MNEYSDSLVYLGGQRFEAKAQPKNHVYNCPS